MKVALVADGRLSRDPRASALAWSLRHVGHRVVAVDPAGGAGFADEAVGVGSRVPDGGGPFATAARRLLPASLQTVLRRRRLSTALTRSGADLVYPMSEDLLAVANRGAGDGAVVRSPAWPAPGRDIVGLAPHHPRFSTSPAGAGLPHHLAFDPSSGGTPAAGRHAGRRVALVYRPTPTTPARYLEAAMVRAGIQVHSPGPELDLGEADGFDAVVVVESPYPPAELTGSRPDLPVLFWVHHGEHHLAANLRLVDRLRPDAVLLAHSWHLAHRFPVPVHRFPFGVPTELFAGEPTPWEERGYDVAMVGVGLDRGGGRYDLRARLAEELRTRLGERARFPGRVTPSELADLYANSKVVINDGGSRHHPITMRVFEAVGAGAFLLTEDQPGTDVLFSRDHYQVLHPDTVVDQVRGLASRPDTGARADAARRHALAHHTYDHRVDQLMEIVDATPPARWRGRPEPQSRLARLVDRDAEVDTVAVAGVPELAAELADRVVWEVDRVADRIAAGGRVDASVFTQPHLRLEEVVAGTRHYVYATEPAAAAVEQAFSRHHPDGTLAYHDGILRADTETEERYRFAGKAAW